LSNELTILDILTLDEIETIETITGKGLDEVFGSGKMITGKEAKVIIWLLQKRTNADAKIEDGGKMTLRESAAFMTGYLDNLKAKN